MNNSQNLVARGHALLARYAAAAALEMPVMANFELQRDLAAVTESLTRRLVGPATYPNKAFNGLPEAVALCLILADVQPDAYAQVMRGICAEELEVFLETYGGLKRLDVLVNGLSDDHDYVFSNVAKTIEVGDPTSERYSLTPSSFLSLVRLRMPSTEAD